MKYTWYEQSLPDGMVVKQVHGVLLTRDRRILVRFKNGEARLTGGRPEDGETWNDTLYREALEESNARCGEMEYLGYQVPEGENYAQVRLVALIDEIMSAQPDPDRDNNWIYGRELMTIEDARISLTASFGEIGEKLVDKAVAIAENKSWFTHVNGLSEVLNLESKD